MYFGFLNIYLHLYTGFHILMQKQEGGDASLPIHPTRLLSLPFFVAFSVLFKFR